MSKHIIYLMVLSTLSFSALGTPEHVSEEIPEGIVQETLPSYSTPISESPATSSLSEGANTLGAVGFVIDQYASPYVGAEAMTTLLRGYKWLDDSFMSSSANDTSFLTMSGRFGKLFLEYTLFNCFATIQHEVFGHGFRLREFRNPVHKYEIGLFSGATLFDAAKYGSLTPNEQIAVTTGGLEAENILAKRIRDRWLMNSELDNRDAVFYLINQYSQSLYISSTRHDRTHFTDGHDIHSYVTQINRWYGDKVISTHNVRNRSYVDLLNPFLYYSLFSVGQYVLDGRQCMQYPMFQIGEYQYLPAMSLVLAPYGTEYNLLNFVRSGDKLYQANIRYGSTGNRKSYGIALEANKIWSNDLLDLDAKLDLWFQPKLYKQTSALATNKFGGALSFITRFKVGACVELVGQAGYKTTGFMPGEVLKHSPILRGGLMVNF
jgi:hypothetical protein